MDKYNLRYKFSKYSENDLEAFKVLFKDNSTNEHHSWNLIFDIENVELKVEPNKSQDVIEISDDELNNTAKSINTYSEFVQPSQNFGNQSKSLASSCNETLNGDIAQCVQDLLENGTPLENSDIIELSKLTQKQLKTFFSNLHETLEIEAITLLVESLCTATCPERLHVVKYFIEFTLVEKVLRNNKNVIFNSKLGQLTENFPEAICDNLLVPIFIKTNPPPIIMELIKLLPSSAADNLSKKIVLNSEKLQLCNFETLPLVLSKNTELLVYQKLVSLMMQSCEEYSSNVEFGKFLVHVISCLKVYITKFDSELKFIAASHNTMYKKRAEKLINDAIASIVDMTQTQVHC